MSLSPIAEKLREAREARDLTQQAAGEAMGLLRTVITQIEQGNRNVSTMELVKFSKLYRQPMAYFLGEMHDEEEPEVLLYRALSSSEKLKKTKEQIEPYIDLCKSGIGLEKILGYQSWGGSPKYDIPLPGHKVEAVLQAEAVAEQERKRLGLGSGPINDIFGLITQQRIWIVNVELPEEVSGLFLNSQHTRMVIMINNKHSASRRRFSSAHEYCHALLDSEHQKWSVSTKTNHDEFIEVRANAFAAAFLMPEEGVNSFLRNINKGQPTRQEQVIFDVATEGRSVSENRQQSNSQNIVYQDIALMASYFGVSYQAATYRLRSLNLISSIESEKLISQYPIGKKFLDSLKMSSSSEKPEQLNHELRCRIAYYAIEAYRRQEISRGRIFELGDELGLGGRELFALAVASVEN